MPKCDMASMLWYLDFEGCRTRRSRRARPSLKLLMASSRSPMDGRGIRADRPPRRGSCTDRPSARVGLELIAEIAEEGDRLAEKASTQIFKRELFSTGSLAMASPNRFTASMAWRLADSRARAAARRAWYSTLASRCSSFSRRRFALALHGDHRRRAADGGQQNGRRQRGHGRPPLAPEPRPLGRPDPARGDRPRVEPGAQVVGQRLGRGVPPPRVLLQALQADRLQVARDLGVELARRLGRTSSARRRACRSRCRRRRGPCPSAGRRGSRPGHRRRSPW